MHQSNKEVNKKVCAKNIIKRYKTYEGKVVRKKEKSAQELFEKVCNKSSKELGKKCSRLEARI